MGDPKRKTTNRGVGPTRPSGMHVLEQVEVDGRPLSFRNTVPVAAPEAKTGQRPRVTLAREEEPPMTEKRERRAIRVDEVALKRWSIRRPIGVHPRIADVSKIDSAPLEPREAFVLQLIDGTLSLSDLVDIAGLSPEEIERIVARLTRLGLVTT